VIKKIIKTYSIQRSDWQAFFQHFVPQILRVPLCRTNLMSRSETSTGYHCILHTFAGERVNNLLFNTFLAFGQTFVLGKNENMHGIWERNNRLFLQPCLVDANNLNNGLLFGKWLQTLIYELYSIFPGCTSSSPCLPANSLNLRARLLQSAILDGLGFLGIVLVTAFSLGRVITHTKFRLI